MPNNKMNKKEVKKKRHKSTHPIFRIPRTFGQKAADNLAKWAGSWTFIILFFIFLAIRIDNALMYVAGQP